MDLATYERIFQYSLGAIFIPTVILLIRFNRQPIEYKWLAIMLSFSFLCDFFNEIQYRFLKIPVNIIGNVYVVINPILLCCFYYHCLKRKSLKVPLILFNIVYIILSIANFAFVQKININTHSHIVEKLLIMSLSIAYFYKVIKELPAEKIYHIGLFWIISSIFIINSAKLVLYSFAHYLVVFKDNLMLLWSIHNMMSIACSLAITAGIGVHYRSQSLTQTHLR